MEQAIQLEFTWPTPRQNSRPIRHYEIPHFLDRISKKRSSPPELASRLTEELPGNAPVTAYSIASALERTIETHGQIHIGEGLNRFLNNLVKMYNHEREGRRKSNTEIAETMLEKLASRGYEGGFDEKTLVTYLRAADKLDYNVDWKKRIVDTSVEIAKTPSRWLRALYGMLSISVALPMLFTHDRAQSTQVITPIAEAPVTYEKEILPPETPQPLVYETPAPAPRYSITSAERDYFAKVVMLEVGPNEPTEGIEALVDMVLNRMEHPSFDKSISELLIPYQFKVIDAYPSFFSTGTNPRTRFSQDFVDTVYRIIDENINGNRTDITEGAIAFNNDASFAGQRWSAGVLYESAKIGNHHFYAGDRYVRNPDGLWTTRP